jgi:hypothetical protein
MRQPIGMDKMRQPIGMDKMRQPIGMDKMRHPIGMDYKLSNRSVISFQIDLFLIQPSQ